MDSFNNDVKDFDDESSEEEYDVDGILPDPSYLHNNNNNFSHNSSSPMSVHQNNNNNYYSHGKRDKSSSSSRENHHKRNKTHAALVHHDDRHMRKVRLASKQQQQQQQQQFHDDRSNRRKKKATPRRKVRDVVVDDDDDDVFATPAFRRDELDASFPPPRLSDFDEMFQRAASNRIRRTKGHHDPGNHPDVDPGCGNPGEQYYLDLGGNIRKVKLRVLHTC